MNFAKGVLYGYSLSLFAEHLMQNILQIGNLIGSKRCYTVFQSSLVDSTYLVCCYLAITVHYVATHAIGISMYGRGDGNDDDGV